MLLPPFPSPKLLCSILRYHEVLQLQTRAYVAYLFDLRGQGAAQCIEDAAAISALFARLTHKHQIPDLLAIFEGLRKPRALELQRRSHSMRAIYGMYDGDEQVMRDRQLTQCEPSEAYSVPWMDPAFQKWMYTYDAAGEAERAWDSCAMNDGSGRKGSAR